MSNIPKPQKYLIYITWLFAGLMWLGGVIGVINDTLDLITLPISVSGTVLIIVAYFGAQQYLKRYPWHTDTGRIFRLNFSMVLPLIGMVALLWLPQILQLTPQKLVFPPEQKGETLIVIATFHHTEGVVDVAIHEEIRRAIQEQKDELNMENVRVHVEPTIIPSTDSEKAEELGKRYNASIVVWGTDTGLRLEVNFLNLKQPDYYVSSVSINETLRTQIALPNEYAQFVINELPGQLTYLTLFAIGQAEYAQGNFDDAAHLHVEAINSLLALDYSEKTLLDLGVDIAYFRLGLIYHLAERLSWAIESYNWALKLNSNIDVAYYNRGLANAKLGEFQSAITDFETAIDFDPENDEYYDALGEVYLDLGQYSTAMAYFDQAIELNSNNPSPYNNQGLILSRQEEYTLALSSFDKAIETAPEIALLYYNRGITFNDIGDFSQAIEDFDRAVELKPDFSEAYFNRGNAHVASGEFTSAIDDFDKAILYNPEDYEAYNNRGLVYGRDLGLHEEAIADFERVILLDPTNSWAYQSLGVAFYSIENYQEAVNNYNVAISLDPENPNLFYSRGLAYMDLGENEKALLDFHRLLEMDPNSLNKEATEKLIDQLITELEN